MSTENWRIAYQGEEKNPIHLVTEEPEVCMTVVCREKQRGFPLQSPTIISSVLKKKKMKE